MQISQNTLNYSSNYYDQNKNTSTEEENFTTSATQEETGTSKSKESKTSANENELSQDEQQQVYELQARDVEVRAHEAAHQAAGGGMTGGASYTYQRGPDNKMYAIGGEVSKSIPGGSTPEEGKSKWESIVCRFKGQSFKDSSPARKS